MSFMTAVRCRMAQAFVRLGRKLHPARKQVLETGAGAIFAVGQLLRDRHLKKPMVVIGAGEQTTRFKLLHGLEDDAVEYVLWDELPAVPTVEDGERISAAWLKQDCDCFIALGSGAVIDVAKAAAARCVNRKSIMGMVGVRRVRHRGMPVVIAAPTAAGSGAESMGVAVLQDEASSVFVIEDRALMPGVALLDPELLADTPRDQVADAGLDGLCRAVEAFLAATSGDNRTKNLSSEAAEHLFVCLEPCWNSGGTIKERTELLSASRMAGWAASAVGSGYARALIRATQTVCGMDFRTAAGVILPAVLEKYGGHATDGLALLAVLADVAEGGSRDERAGAVIRRIRAMVFRMGLPDMLEGVTADQAAEIADLAAATANPRYISPVVWTAEDCLDLMLSICATEAET